MIMSGSLGKHLNYLLKSIGLRIERERSYKARQSSISGLLQAQSMLLRIWDQADALKRTRYGFVDTHHGTYYPILGSLYPSRYTGSGFFVAATKLLLTVLECQKLQIPIRNVDNTLSMEMYKDRDFVNNWSAFYADIDQHSAENFAQQKQSFNRDALRSLSPHGDYLEIFHELGAEWIASFLDIYCRPSLSSQLLSDQYTRSLGISRLQPLAMYYRGTDKYREIEPIPTEEVFSFVDQYCQSHSATKLLIQTDQQQVRDSAKQHYGDRCIYIRDLPVTTGSVALHHLSDHPHSREYTGQQLVAMADTIGRCPTLVTTTGNVGFFLAMKVFARGGKVHQMRHSPTQS